MPLRQLQTVNTRYRRHTVIASAKINRTYRTSINEKVTWPGTNIDEFDLCRSFGVRKAVRWFKLRIRWFEKSPELVFRHLKRQGTAVGRAIGQAIGCPKALVGQVSSRPRLKGHCIAFALGKALQNLTMSRSTSRSTILIMTLANENVR